MSISSRTAPDLRVPQSRVNNIKTANITKIKKLLYMLAVSVPPELNINKLSSIIGASHHAVYDYMEYLKNAGYLTDEQRSRAGWIGASECEVIFERGLSHCPVFG